MVSRICGGWEQNEVYRRASSLRRCPLVHAEESAALVAKLVPQPRAEEQLIDDVQSATSDARNLKGILQYPCGQRTQTHSASLRLLQSPLMLPQTTSALVLLIMIKL